MSAFFSLEDPAELKAWGCRFASVTSRSYMLCCSRFFPRYFPETEKLLGPHLFGYNRKEHLLHVVLFIPACLLMAWLANVVF